MLSEKHVILNAISPAADGFNTGPNSDVFAMRDLESITFIFQHVGGTTGNGSLIVKACDDVSANNPTAIAARYRKKTTGASDAWGAVTALPTTGVTTVATEDTIYEIEVKATDLPKTQDFVFLDTTEVTNDPVVTSCIAIGELKYQGLTPPTVLA